MKKQLTPLELRELGFFSEEQVSEYCEKEILEGLGYPTNNQAIRLQKAIN